MQRVLVDARVLQIKTYAYSVCLLDQQTGLILLIKTIFYHSACAKFT